MAIAHPLPSMAARRILLAVSQGRPAIGHCSALGALLRRGLINDAGQLTDAGRDQVAQLKATAEARHAA